MTYMIALLRRAQKELEDLQTGDYERVRDAIARLADNPRPAGCIKLTGREGWRIRVGNNRVIYTIEDKELVVTVIKIGNRRDVYL